MGQAEIKINVPCGYIIKEKTKTVELFKAYELLNTKRQHHYTKAERRNDQAVLYWHILRCPHCGKETPAYPHYLYNDCHAIPRISEFVLSEWAMVQMSLFDIPNNTLQFQQPAWCDIEYTCARCGNVSRRSSEEVDIVIGYDDTSVYISRKIRDIKDVIDLHWLRTVTLSVQFPMHERIVFDFDKGIASRQLIAGENILANVNINDFNSSKDDGLLPTLISQNNIVKRTLKKCFQLFWQSPIPYTLNEISLQKLVFMTHFVDFSRDFYDAIPFAENSNCVDESFVPIAHELRNPMCAIKMLTRSSLPKSKSIKRLFAEKSGLFFYLEECEFLFDVFGDLNLLCRVLNSKEAYQIVSMLHSYPGIKSFYKDYCYVKSEKSLCSQLMNNSTAVNNQAIRYCALSTFGKQAEQKKWKKNRRFFEQGLGHLAHPDVAVSIPMHDIPGNINDCTIDRYCFKWLRTKNEYQEAGKRLDNCLKTWCSYDNPVVAVYKGRKIIAAIEIDGNCLRQAFRIHNTIIDKRSSLYLAIKKWCDKYSIIKDNDYT